MRINLKSISLLFALILSICFLSSNAFAFIDPPDSLPDGRAFDDRLGNTHRYLKYFQSEITFVGGNYLGDEWQNTWDIGGNYALYFNETWGVGFGYLYSPIRFDGGSNFGRTVTDDAVHVVHGEVYISNDCAFRAGDTLIECELFTFIGGGEMMINRDWNPTALIGGGIRIYTPVKGLSFRFDVESLMHQTPNPSGDTFNADMVTNLGISYYFGINKNPRTNNQ